MMNHLALFKIKKQHIELHFADSDLLFWYLVVVFFYLGVLFTHIILVSCSILHKSLNQMETTYTLTIEL